MSSIVVSEFQVPDVQLLGSTAKLRLYCDGDWTDSLGTKHFAGTPRSVDTFYQEIACTLVGGVLTVPSFITYSTLDALQNANVRVSGEIFDEAGAWRKTLFEGWFIPTSPTTTTRNALEIANQGQSLLWPPSQYLNSYGVQQLIDAVIGVLRFATSVIAGWVRLSVAAANVLDPVAVGDNDPRVASDTSYASLAAAVTAIGSTPTTLNITTAAFPNGGNTTVPVTLELRPIGAGTITMTTGQTVTVASDTSKWPRRKLFLNALSGQGTVILSGTKDVWPEWWATNTTQGTTDMAPAMQAAWASILTTGGTQKLADGSSYRLGSFNGQTDASYAALVGIDPGVAGLTFKLEGNAQIISSVKTGTALTGIAWFFVRGNSNVKVSGPRFKYDGGASATKLITGFNFGLGSGYGAEVSGCEFRNFYNAIVTTSTGLQDLSVHDNRFIAEAGLASYYSGSPSLPGQSIGTASGDLASLTVVNNTFDGNAANDGTAYQDGLVLSYSKRNIITGNQIVRYEIEGIQLPRNTDVTDPPNNVIANNNFSGSHPTSLAIRSDTPNTVISGNTIRDAQAGIYVNVADTGSFIGYVAENVQIVNNTIYMVSTYASGNSIGIFCLSKQGLIEGNTVAWPQSNSGYGSVVSKGIEVGVASQVKIVNNTIASFFYKLTVTPVAGTFVAGEAITGSTSGDIASVFAVSGSTLTYNQLAFANNMSFGNFVAGETITGGTSGATATISSFQTPVANTFGIYIDSTSPVILDGNKTVNLAQGINLLTNAATKNGPFEIIKHTSFLDTAQLGSDFDPSANLRFVYRKQEVQFTPASANWYRIQTALTTLNGRYTVSLGTEQIAVFDVNYIASGAPITGAVSIINKSLRSPQYVTAVRVGIASGTTIALDIQIPAGAIGLPMFVALDTGAANQFLFYDVATRKTLNAPVVNPSAPTSLVTAVIGGLLPGEGAALSVSSNTITPTNAIHQVGAGLIKTITVPAGFIGGYGSGSIEIVPTAAFTYDATANVLGTGTAVVGRTMVATYSASTGKWSMSY